MNFNPFYTNATTSANYTQIMVNPTIFVKEQLGDKLPTGVERNKWYDLSAEIIVDFDAER